MKAFPFKKAGRMNKRLFPLISFILIVSFLLSSCGPVTSMPAVTQTPQVTPDVQVRADQIAWPVKGADAMPPPIWEVEDLAALRVGHVAARGQVPARCNGLLRRGLDAVGSWSGMSAPMISWRW